MRPNCAPRLKQKNRAAVLLHGNVLHFEKLTMLPAIFSLSGTTLTSDEEKLFRDANPVGFILFARNIVDIAQLKKLTASLKDIVGRNCPILIDQEGGRVQRLGPPHWPKFRNFASFGEIYKIDPAQARAELAAETAAIAAVLNDVGINVNCSPVADLRYPGAHDIIGDRAFSPDPSVVADLCDVVCRTYLDAGITPIIKHAPGHGRALSDSHLELPTVDVPVPELDATDFYPFRELSTKSYGSQLWAMTAHILYPGIDRDLPATLSAPIMNQIVRDRLGFTGVIIGDDMDMKALDAYGDPVARSIATLNAGCDLVLNCHGKLPDMQALADKLPQITPESATRLAATGFGGYVS
jgi:beta-N-acetylhexosaminidase